MLAAGVAGAVLATGGLAAVNLATESAGATQGADAQSGDDFATTAEVEAANARAQAGINMGKRVWNLLGIHGAEPGELVGKNSGPIKQERGQGGGLPEQALSAGVQAKLNGSGSGGPAGLAGPQGATGPAGPPGLANVETVTSAPLEVNPGLAGSQIARCPGGKVALGGGVTPTQPNGTPVINSEVAGRNLGIVQNYPDSTAWIGGMENLTGGTGAHGDPSLAEPIFFVVYAVCAEVAT